MRLFQLDTPSSYSQTRIETLIIALGFALVYGLGTAARMISSLSADYTLVCYFFCFLLIVGIIGITRKTGYMPTNASIG